MLETSITSDFGDLDLEEIFKCIRSLGFYQGDYDDVYDVFCCADFSSTDDIYALAAAIEYYNGDAKRAITCILESAWLHLPYVDTYEELAVWYADSFHADIPDVIWDYLDTESLGSDFCREVKGEFTCYGFFTPNSSHKL